MGARISLRDDFDGIALRRLSKRCRDGTQTRRLLALAEIYDGARRTEAARIGAVTLQIVRDWVIRFNAEGPDGLINRKAAGPKRKLDDAQRQALADFVERGPFRRSTRWCDGGAAIWRNGSGRSSASLSAKRQLAVS
jgi:hypothetical protein